MGSCRATSTSLGGSRRRRLPDSDYDARALSWVRASHAQLDTPLWRTVSEWLASDWPLGSVEYAPRA